MEVTILGQSYLLGCPDGGETGLLEAVATVDREMSAIRDSRKVRARERIAVLAALNLAYALSAPERNRADDDGVGPPPSAAADAAALDRLIARVDEALDTEGRLF